MRIGDGVGSQGWASFDSLPNFSILRSLASSRPFYELLNLFVYLVRLNLVSLLNIIGLVAFSLFT